MTKLRTPLTFPHAVTRVAALLGFDEAGRVVGRSERCVRDWSDPDSTARPTVEQALALDAAFRAAGGDGAPLFETYASLPGEEVAQHAAFQLRLADDLARASRGDNPDCLASFVAQIVIVRQLQPSLTPNAAILLPQGAPRRRRAANDDVPEPANDADPAPPPADAAMSG